MKCPLSRCIDSRGMWELTANRSIEYELVRHLEGINVHMFLVTIHRRRTHYHSDSELLIPIEGSVSIQVADQTYLVRQNDFCFVGAFEPHRLESTEESNVLLVLQFNPDFSREYYPDFAGLRMRSPLFTLEGSPELYAELLKALLALIDSLGKRRTGYPLGVVAALNGLAYAMVRYGDFERVSRGSMGREERRRARMINVMGYLQEHFAGKPSLEELAGLEGVKAAHLSHFIKDAFGLGFREYVNRLRLEQAIRLMNATDLRLVDVCMEAGFSDYRYFCRSFVEAFGMSPQQVREASGGWQHLMHKVEDDPAAREHDVSRIDESYKYICQKLDDLWSHVT